MPEPREDDLTTEIPPPHETDGPQQPVDDSELEDDGHHYDHSVGEDDD